LETKIVEILRPEKVSGHLTVILTNILDESGFKRYNEEPQMFKPRRVSLSTNQQPIMLSPQRRHSALRR